MPPQEKVLVKSDAIIPKKTVTAQQPSRNKIGEEAADVLGSSSPPPVICRDERATDGKSARRRIRSAESEDVGGGGRGDDEVEPPPPTVAALYETRFDPKTYFEQYCRSDDDPELSFWFRHLSDVFAPDGIIGSTEPGSVVDVGCGPVPSFSAAAARWATSVTMADYLPQNTAEISKWKTDAAGKLDWSHQLGVVAGLENSSVGVIEDRLRAKMGEIIACDLYRRNPIYPHRRRFAVALSSLCLEFAAVDLDDYAALLKHLATLIEPGGFLVMQGALGNSYYMLGGTRFPSVSLTESAICDSLAEAGLVLEFWDTLSRRCPVADKPADHDGVFFLVARHVCCSADELF